MFRLELSGRHSGCDVDANLADFGGLILESTEAANIQIEGRFPVLLAISAQNLAAVGILPEETMMRQAPV